MGSDARQSRPWLRPVLWGGAVTLLALAAYRPVSTSLQRASDDEHQRAILEQAPSQRLDAVTLADDPTVVATYRGIGSDGLSNETGLRPWWPEGGPPELFRRPIGGGHSGMVVDAGRIYTMEQRLEQEVVVAYDLGTGGELWAHGYDARFSESMGGDGPRSTPTVHGTRVFSLGAVGDLHALDKATGEVHWSVNILASLEASNLTWGLAASPLIVGDLVVVASSGIDSAGFVAYRQDTGAEVWTSEFLLQGYTTPVLTTIAGRDSILHLAGDGLAAIDPETGDTLWQHPWKTFGSITGAQPIVLGPRDVFISTAYGTGSARVEITPTDTGFETREIWRTEFMQNKFNSSVLVDGVIYGLHEGVLAAQDPETGTSLWEGQSFGFGQLLYAQERLLVVAEDGGLHWLAVSREGAEHKGYVKALEGRTWAVPTLAGGRLLVRNERELVAYDLRADRSSP